MRPHQKEGWLTGISSATLYSDQLSQGVMFLYECVMGLRKHEGQGCILADEMWESYLHSFNRFPTVHQWKGSRENFTGGLMSASHSFHSAQFNDRPSPWSGHCSVRFFTKPLTSHSHISLSQNKIYMEAKSQQPRRFSSCVLCPWLPYVEHFPSEYQTQGFSSQNWKAEFNKWLGKDRVGVVICEKDKSCVSQFFYKSAV